MNITPIPSTTVIQCSPQFPRKVGFLGRLVQKVSASSENFQPVSNPSRLERKYADFEDNLSLGVWEMFPDPLRKNLLSYLDFQSAIKLKQTSLSFRAMVRNHSVHEIRFTYLFFKNMAHCGAKGRPQTSLELLIHYLEVGDISAAQDMLSNINDEDLKLRATCQLAAFHATHGDPNLKNQLLDTIKSPLVKQKFYHLLYVEYFVHGMFEEAEQALAQITNQQERNEAFAFIAEKKIETNELTEAIAFSANISPFSMKREYLFNLIYKKYIEQNELDLARNIILQYLDQTTYRGDLAKRFIEEGNVQAAVELVTNSPSHGFMEREFLEVMKIMKRKALFSEAVEMIDRHFDSFTTNFFQVKAFFMAIKMIAIGLNQPEKAFRRTQVLENQRNVDIARQWIVVGYGQKGNINHAVFEMEQICNEKIKIETLISLVRVLGQLRNHEAALSIISRPSNQALTSPTELIRVLLCELNQFEDAGESILTVLETVEDQQVRDELCIDATRKSQLQVHDILTVANMISDKIKRYYHLIDIGDQFADRGKVAEALQCANSIDRPFYRSWSQYSILSHLVEQGLIKDALQILSSIQDPFFKYSALKAIPHYQKFRQFTELAFKNEKVKLNDIQIGTVAIEEARRGDFSLAIETAEMTVDPKEKDDTYKIMSSVVLKERQDLKTAVIFFERIQDQSIQKKAFNTILKRIIQNNELDQLNYLHARIPYEPFQTEIQKARRKWGTGLLARNNEVNKKIPSEIEQFKQSIQEKIREQDFEGLFFTAFSKMSPNAYSITAAKLYQRLANDSQN